MPAPTAGNVFTRRTVDQRAPITVITIPVLAAIAASTTALVGSLVVPAQPGKVKGVLKRVRWIQGGVASTLGGGWFLTRHLHRALVLARQSLRLAAMVRAAQGYAARCRAWHRAGRLEDGDAHRQRVVAVSEEDARVLVGGLLAL